MAVRVARQAEGFGRTFTVALLTVGLLLPPAAPRADELSSPAPSTSADPSQDSATTHPSPTPDGPAPPTTAMSRACEVPAYDIATPAPLPHLQAALQAKRAIRVLAIGSSSTVGVGASSPSHSYPAQLETILERTFKGLDVVIVNRGVSGEVSAATADRLKTLVGIEKPDLVLWQVGTNDALMRVPVDDFKATVGETLRWLKAREVDTVLVGLQYTLKVSKDPHYIAIRMALRDIAAAEGVLLVRRYEAMEFIEKAKAGELTSPDELHMNDLGYRCMAEHIARAMVVSAFLRAKGGRRS